MRGLRSRPGARCTPTLTRPILTHRAEQAARFGAIAWIGSIQFFIAQGVVQTAWSTPFSLKRNFISDLGNTVCGNYPQGSGNWVCSPWHAWMNASFILVGLTTLAGAALTRESLGPGRLAHWGMGMIAVAGLGFILVGMFPENVSFPPHKLGAGLQFICGNFGQVLLGLAVLPSRRQHLMARFSVGSGAMGLLATALLVSGHDLGMGIGGMERLAAYPLPLWCIMMGLGTVLPAASMRGGNSTGIATCG